MWQTFPSATCREIHILNKTTDIFIAQHGIYSISTKLGIIDLWCVDNLVIKNAPAYDNFMQEIMMTVCINYVPVAMLQTSMISQ